MPDRPILARLRDILAAVQLDRGRGKVLDVIIQSAIRRSRESQSEAQALLDAGFPGPAFVWAVRSIEIFVKEVMLLPLFLEELPEGEWDAVWDEAWTQIRATFRNGRWKPALRKINDAYGPIEPMWTEDGKDVWQVWSSVVFPRRGDLVHGMPPSSATDLVTADEASVIVGWAGQMMDQLVLRLIAAKKHPLHDLFVAALEAARDQLNAEAEQGGEGAPS